MAIRVRCWPVAVVAVGTLEFLKSRNSSPVRDASDLMLPTTGPVDIRYAVLPQLRLHTRCDGIFHAYQNSMSVCNGGPRAVDRDYRQAIELAEVMREGQNRDIPYWRHWYWDT